MSRAKPLLGFLCRFVIVFGLLTVPWPGWQETYARCLQKCATAVYGSFGSKGRVEFMPNPLAPAAAGRSTDTIICVGNREQLNADGVGPKSAIEFECRLEAYLPTAMVIALVLATRISWRRRLWASAWGLLWINLFIAFLLWAVILAAICYDPSLGLFSVSPFWQEVLEYTQEVLVRGRYAAAVLIWIIVTFRRDDLTSFLGKEAAVPSPGDQDHFSSSKKASEVSTGLSRLR